tara:strand:+ start:1860 stop:3779 length:1920 start_codon:yes stop_codon:yes gene_type:complete
MSLKGLFQLGKRLLKGKKESATPATGQQQKLLTYEKKAPQETGLELATKEIRNPPIVRKQTKALYMGDDVAPAFGSSTYDWAMKIGPGRYTADEWLNHLTSTRKENFKIFGKAAQRKVRDPKKFTYDSGPFAGKQAVVTSDELFDSNLAIFNSAGDLTGGLLFAAKKFGLKLDANEIGAMIKLNPINRLKAVELGVPDDAIEQLITKSKSITKQLDFIANKYPGTDIGNSLRDAVYQLRALTSSTYTGSVNSVITKFKNSVRAARDGTSINQSDFKNLNRAIGEVDEAAAKVTNRQNKTQYANEEGYTLPGGKNYRETIFRLDEEIPTNRNAFTSPKHFSEQGKNQIYHVRFDTRVTPDGKKALLIHEIQSDVNQAIAKQLTKAQQLDGRNRVNPFNADIEINLLISERAKISARLNKALSEQDIGGINANTKILNDVQTKISNLIQRNPKRRDYFPMVEADQYGDHALKYLLNKAAKENVDFVAVAPFERLSMRQGYKAGNERFYGYANGKGINNKGSSVMANVMKRAAKFYDSKTETIKLNLSDPKKPYKSIGKKEMTYPDDHKFGGKKINSIVHGEASDVQQQGFRFIEDGNPNLYFDAFAVKVSPLMRYTQKTYKAKGGLVVDMFKPIGYNRAWL